jgi:hypothetical protein
MRGHADWELKAEITARLREVLKEGDLVNGRIGLWEYRDGFTDAAIAQEFINKGHSRVTESIIGSVRFRKFGKLRERRVQVNGDGHDPIEQQAGARMAMLEKRMAQIEIEMQKFREWVQGKLEGKGGEG